MTWLRLAASVVVLALILGGATWGLDIWRARQAEARYPPDGVFVDIDGQRVHVVTMGDHGPAVVLIHGASGSARDLTFDLAPELAKRYRVFVPDRPGFGYSDPLPAGQDTIFNQAKLLQKATLEVGARNPIVLGHSYGGAVAIAWAVTLPDTLKGLVPVSAPSEMWDSGLPLLYKLTAPPLGQALLVPLISAWTPPAVIAAEVRDVFKPQQMPKGYIRWFGPGMTLRVTTMRVNARERASLKSQIAQMIPKYPQLDLPVVSVHGTADTIVSEKIHAIPFTKTVPGATLISLKGIGHMTPHVATKQVVEAVNEVAKRAGLN
ncbi:Pimeloyl-ACP methyl ester carboxylesterase [Thioclava dalianensis]|uniref:alpha/beta fold hydrolase n=1 Tax=Thioclava dalianensis TaxID=1185766 RepID=UPI0005716097|nr:alpha/beta hydrolase [Thioclava dalianensis]SFN53690.1 Pimeloyl-ACP methyl ester carboxylesterase [Thioclava dalianensis]